MRLKQLLSNAWLISLIPLAVVVCFVPVNAKKYNLTLLRTDLVPPGYYIFYDDLDNDGTSERISTFDLFNASGITISNRSGIIDQWNFKGSFDFDIKKSIIITGDKDGNGQKELYAFTIEADSVFLNYISDPSKQLDADENNQLPVRSRFISTVGKGIKKPDPIIVATEMYDLDGDSTKELIFGINTGFSHFPRRVFAYYVDKDSLVMSPQTGYYTLSIFQTDIDNDGKNEFLPWGYAAGNVSPEESKYHDYSSFLMVLGRDLQFTFDPIEFKEIYSSVAPFMMYDQSGKHLACIFRPHSSDSSSIVYSISPGGLLRDSLHLDNMAANIENVSNDQYFIPVPSSGYELYDRNFKRLKIIEGGMGAYQIKDIDGDNASEYVLQLYNEGKILVCREGLKNPVSLKLTIAAKGWDVITLRKGYETGPVLSIQTGQNNYLVEYKENAHYYFSYLSYPGIYVLIFLFTYSLINVSRNQLKRRYENEKKVSELQLALVRNQLEPHFILNAINSIIYSVTFGEKDLASDSLRCFSSMYRDLVLSAGESRRSIEDEIAFCENYLTLEKMRFGDKFDYCVNVSDNVDLKKFIPKFLIQIHAENAVKHGLAPLESGGILNIRIKNEINELLIEITDNGIGRKKSSETEKGTTGKGLATMNELYSLYSKLYNENITSEIVDLFDDQRNPAGTMVVIKIISQA